MYIVRFESMRKTYKAAEWALVGYLDVIALLGRTNDLFRHFQVAQKSKTVIWWNVWVLLAMPVVWLTWYVYITVK